MKKFYFLLTLLMLSTSINAQTYEFGIVNVSGNNFKIVAVPDFNSAGNTNVSDAGFSLTIPAGSSDIVNLVNLLGTSKNIMKRCLAIL